MDLNTLIERFQIERKKFDRSGIYAYTQRALAYNSNKIKGSTLSEEQTDSLFDTGMLPVSDDYYRAKDVEETNGYAIGDYKKRPNMVGMYETALPKEVPEKMRELLEWYHGSEKTLEVMAEFHARYESLHPFQDGNGRTGRLILFRECLKSGLVPIIIEDQYRPEYLEGLKEYREPGKTGQLLSLFQKRAKNLFGKN